MLCVHAAAQWRAHDCAQLGIYARSSSNKLLCDDGNCNNICSNESECVISEAYYLLSLRYNMKKRAEITPAAATAVTKKEAPQM